jgi:hypothetical protein
VIAPVQTNAGAAKSGIRRLAVRFVQPFNSAGFSSRASAWLYIFAWVATLVDQFWHLPPAGNGAGIAMLAFLLLEFPRQRRYAQVLFIALCAIGMVGVVGAADPIGLFLSAWRRGAGYGAFFLALSSLRDAAETSPLVRRCGQHLVVQPPGRRYAALTGGGHLFGIILSYGAIELLGAMVMRANTVEAAGGSSDVRAIRSRRMLMAIYRGFCVMNCWSPLNLMTAVVSTAVPAAPMRLLLPIAFVVSLGMTALGWLEDRLTAPHEHTEKGARPQSLECWSIHLRIVVLVLVVMLLAEAGSVVLGASLVATITLVVPLVGFGWVLVQSQRFVLRAGLAVVLPRTIGVLRRRAGRFLLRVPAFRSEATVLAGSGFMGVAVGGALPASALAPLIAHLPPLAVALLVPVLLIATGQIGLNPVAVIALLGAAMPDPTLFGVSPAVLAFACMLGWGLAVNMTPMSASAITTARWAGVSPWTVSTTWNALYTASALLLAWIAIGIVFVASQSAFTLG